MRNREYGVDLFRIMGLFFVNTLHACLYNGFYYEAQEGGAMLFFNSVRWLLFGCNAMFMLMTGYLKSGSPWKKGYYKSLLVVVVGYVLTCVISYPIRYFWLEQKDSLEVWVNRFFTFSNYAWYAEMYIGLFILSPILNMAVNSIQDNRKLWMLVLSMVFITSLPAETRVQGPDGAYALIPDYWSGLYPVTLYLIGAAIRKTKPKVPAWVGLTIAVFTAVGLGYATLTTATKGFYSGYGQGYGGFWVMIMVTGLFLSIYQLQINPRVGKVLAFISGGAFEGYILSYVLDIRYYKDFAQWHDPQYYWLLFLCVTLPIFLASLTAGNLVHALSKAIGNGLYKGFDALAGALRKLFSKIPIPKA